MTKTYRLNDLPFVLLAGAAARDNGSLVPLPESCDQDTTRIDKAETSLQRRKLVEELPVTNRNLAWREENQGNIGLFITPPAAPQSVRAMSRVPRKTQPLPVRRRLALVMLLRR